MMTATMNIKNKIFKMNFQINYNNIHKISKNFIKKSLNIVKNVQFIVKITKIFQKEKKLIKLIKKEKKE